MSATEQAFITGTVVRWARERARVKQDKVAERLHAPVESVASWELGNAFPTFRQAQRLAEVLHIPFGYLFLPSPPDEKIPLPDFRAVRNAETSKPSAELIDLLNDVLVKQQWYRDFLVEQGTQPLPFVGRSSIRDGIGPVAESIRATLHIDNTLRQRCTTWDQFLRTIIHNAEAAGILVMRSGFAVGNTRRPLSLKEFRGFAISDPIAPLIFINGKDWPTAQIFTVAHEVVHIWIGASGIVLVQREMESGRSPLASITPFSAGQFAPPNIVAHGGAAASKTATGFKRRSGWLVPISGARATVVDCVPRLVGGFNPEADTP